MNIIIIGIGKVGLTLVEQLSEEDHNIIVIDKKRDVIERTINDYDVRGIVGNGADSDIQIEANINEADLLIACTSSDELNILLCMIAKKLADIDTIARVRNPEYFELFMSKELGLNLMVNPEYEGALKIFRILRSPGAIMIEPFADGKVDLVEFKLSGDNPMVGLTVSQFSQQININMLICAIERNEEVLIPNGSTLLKEEDKIYFTASTSGINKTFEKIGFKKSILKNVIIVGGGRISFYLAKKLEKIGTKVKIIERNPEKCLELLSQLNKAEVISADASDDRVLVEEGLKKADAIAILTGADEENIMIALFAKSVGVQTIVTKINRLSYYSILKASGIDSIISPRFITADQIVRYVRARKNSDTVLNLYKIVNSKVEALEFIVTDKFEGLSIPLKDLPIKENILVANILRGKEVITPHGNQTIEKGDKVIIVTSEDNLDDLKGILK